MVVQRKANVVLLHELLNSRQRRRRWIARDDHANSSPLAVFKLRPNIFILVFGKIDRPSRMQLDSRRGVIGQRRCLGLRVHRQMILGVLQVDIGHTRLFQECNHLRPVEIPEGVTGDPEPDRRFFIRLGPVGAISHLC